MTRRHPAIACMLPTVRRPQPSVDYAAIFADTIGQARDIWGTSFTIDLEYTPYKLALSFPGLSRIVYDQYLGETLSLLTGVFVTGSEDAAKTVVARLLAEELFKYRSRLAECVWFGFRYASSASALNFPDTPPRLWEVAEEVHERFVLLHESAHCLFQTRWRQSIATFVDSDESADVDPGASINDAFRDRCAHLRRRVDARLTETLARRGLDQALNREQLEQMSDEEVVCDFYAHFCLALKFVYRGVDFQTLCRAMYLTHLHVELLTYVAAFVRGKPASEYQVDAVVRRVVALESLKWVCGLLLIEQVFDHEPQGLADLDMEGFFTTLELDLIELERSYYRLLFAAFSDVAASMTTITPEDSTAAFIFGTFGRAAKEGSPQTQARAAAKALKYIGWWSAPA